MIHNPCGDINPSSPCMGQSGCKKFFPKRFLDSTSQSDNDYYIQYRRRSPGDGGEWLEREISVGCRRRRVMLDNSWVVPHNRKLLRMFTCHINVELCVSRVGGIKYLFEYVCKGSDRVVTMELIAENQRYDEIGMFQDARYVSASEAAWRLFSFNIVDRNPNVVRLDVHLEDRHTLIFDEDDEHAALARSRPGTKLTEWFNANQNYPGSRHILYHEYCRCFTWNASEKKWNPRARLRRSNRASEDERYDFSGPGINVFGRIYTVSPREGEGYFLRLLLTHKPGAISFEELRTVDGEVCDSFRLACSRMGLFADDEEWGNALCESFRSSFTPLSRVFVTILAHCSPSDPRTLWDEHKHMFQRDIRQRAQGLNNRARREQLSDDDTAIEYVLHEIQSALQSMGRFTLQDFDLPEPANDLPPLFGRDQHCSQAGASHSRAGLFQQTLRNSLSRLNQQQKQAFNQVVGSIIPGVTSDTFLNDTSSIAPQLDAVPLPLNRVFFLDAPGGTGKTFLINVIQAFLELRDMRVLPVATSAVAAVLLIGGRTAHSTFKIPIPALQDSICTISANSNTAEKLREVTLIIWDEVVMCHRFCIEAVDRTLRDLMKRNLPFGGKFLLFSGDFRQILPVIQGRSRGQIVNACIKSSYVFDCCTTLRLQDNMRLQALRNDPSADQEALQFPNFLLQVGEGRVRSHSSADPDLIDLP